MKPLRPLVWAPPLVAAWLLCGWLESSGALQLRNVTIERVDNLGRSMESAQTVELPYQDSSRPYEASYRVSGELDYGPLSHSSVRIVADDCVTSLLINGRSVDLSGIPKEKLCDYQMGFSIVVSQLLKSGTNHLAVVFKNGGGDLAFRILPDPSPFGRKSRLAQLLIGLILGVLLIRALLPALSRDEQLLAGVVLVLGAMMRLDFILSLHPPELYAFSDAGGYLSNARDMAAGIFRVQQVFQGVGLPLLLAWTLKVASGQFWAFHWLHWMVSVATVILVWRSTARLWGERSGLWALVLLSFHFPFISFTGFFMAETLFSFVLAVLFYLMVRWPYPWRAEQGAQLGAIFMLGHSIKGLNAFFIPFVILWAAAWSWKNGARSGKKLLRAMLRPMGGFLAGLLVVALAQAVLTYSLWGKVVLSAPTGGLNLVEGKCPAKVNKDSAGYGWQSPLFNQLGENQEKTWPRPFTDQGYFWKEGMKCILADPLVLVSSLSYVHYLFADNQLWPSNVTFPRLTRHSGMIFTSLLFPGILIALLLLGLRPLEKDRMVFLHVASILFCSWALKAEMRYRIPFDVFFIPLAVFGWSWVASKLGLKSVRLKWRALVGATVALALFLGVSVYWV